MYYWLSLGFIEIKQDNPKRAFEKFNSVIARAKNNLKKKFLFGGHVGCGIASYIEGKYEIALDHFLKAIQSFPCTNASLRVAISACCYKLGNYDRATAAIDAAINIDPSNANALVLKSLLLQMESQKLDRSKREKSRLYAFENCVLASSIDSKCVAAVIQMSNHIFHTWRLISENINLTVMSENVILLPSNTESSVCIGDILRLNRHQNSYIIKNIKVVNNNDGEKQVEIETEKPITNVSNINILEYRSLNEVVRLVENLLASNTNKKVQSEAYYILGKVCHIQGDIEGALIKYLQSLQNDAEDMILAAFGAAQIYFSKQEFTTSLKIFERIHEKYPLDKDTHAYVILLKGLCNKEITSFDILREVAAGFPYQVELWLNQGNLRLNDSNQFPQALKCFMNAYDYLEENKLSIHPTLLSNIAILNHSIGKYNTSFDFMKRALVEENNASDDINPDFYSAELENIFYSWSNAICTLVYNATDEIYTCEANDNESPVDLSQKISIGDDIIIGDYLCKVTYVDLHSLKVYCPLPITNQFSNNTYDLKIKIKWNNFYCSITNCYNMARILESCGGTTASTEIYIQLLKQHPSFIECYLRLSEIAKDMGKYTEALLWLTKALSVDNDEPDVNISVADLYQRSMLLDDAKKSYEKVCSKNRHDARVSIPFVCVCYLGF